MVFSEGGDGKIFLVVWRPGTRDDVSGVDADSSAGDLHIIGQVNDVSVAS
jgi:hypothetical protein